MCIKETLITLKVLNSKTAKDKGERLSIFQVLKQICVTFMNKKKSWKYEMSLSCMNTQGQILSYKNGEIPPKG